MSVVIYIIFICAGMAFAIAGKKLTVSASITGAILCTCIYLGIGWKGVAIMTAFFAMGTLATSWKKQEKEKIGLAQENKEGRKTGQVMANAAMGGTIGFLAILFPQQAALLYYLLAAAFSSATADTISSELGSVYGSRFYDILSFRKAQPGPDGIVSIEGLFFGIVGSSVIAFIYVYADSWNEYVASIIVAGTIGNLSDSYLGATLERRSLINNDVVNFANTAIAVAAAYFMVSV